MDTAEKMVTVSQLRTGLAKFCERYSMRRLWGLVHDSQQLAQQLHKKYGKTEATPLRDQRVRLQVICLHRLVPWAEPRAGAQYSRVP